MKAEKGGGGGLSPPLPMYKESFYLAFRRFPPHYHPQRKMLADIDEIEAHLRSQIPKGDIGLMLSHGIDSVIIAALLPKGTHAYTVRFDEIRRDESIEASRYAKKFELVHHIVTVHWKDYLDYQDELIKHKGMPLLPVEPAIYMVAQKAAEDGIRILLTGTGSYHQFGEKAKYFFYDTKTFIRKFVWLNPKKILKKGISSDKLCSDFIHNGEIDKKGLFDCDDDAHIAETNAIGMAGLEYIAPFKHTDYPIDYNLALEQGRYPIKQLFQRLVDEKPHGKCGFPRPTGYWLQDWKPTSPNFRKQISELHGNCKWLLYSLERYWNLYGNSED